MLFNARRSGAIREVDVDTVISPAQNDLPQFPADSIKASLARLEQLLAGMTPQGSDTRLFAALDVALRELHARVRVHHAESSISSADDAQKIPPECLEELTRLSSEHSTILGYVDRIIRTVDSMADRPPEDRDVFFARVREVIAVLRRHEAEEDRVFSLALWRDTGGES